MSHLPQQPVKIRELYFFVSKFSLDFALETEKNV